MKVKVVFDSNDQVVSLMEVSEQGIDVVAEEDQQIYEFELGDDFFDEESFEQIEAKIREARCSHPD